MIEQQELLFETRGRGSEEITNEIAAVVADAGISRGVCHVFLMHTSASLLITENADPTVRRDLEAWLSRAAPDGDALFRHTAEGPDDMPAHVHTALFNTALTLPIQGGHLCRGTWQGIFLFEHRTSPHRRRVVVTINGE